MGQKGKVRTSIFYKTFFIMPKFWTFSSQGVVKAIFYPRSQVLSNFLFILSQLRTSKSRRLSRFWANIGYVGWWLTCICDLRGYKTYVGYMALGWLGPKIFYEGQTFYLSNFFAWVKFFWRVGFYHTKF